MVLHSAKGPKEQKLLCFRVLLESPTSRLYRIKKVQITKGNRFVINLKHSLALLSLILKMTIFQIVFLSVRESLMEQSQASFFHYHTTMQ